MYQLFSALPLLGLVCISAVVRLQTSYKRLQRALTLCQVEASPHRSWGSNGDNSPVANQAGDAGAAGSNTVAGAVQNGITTIIATTTIFQMQTQTQTQTQTQMVHLAQGALGKEDADW
jgi:hypothetical protein